MKFLLDTHALLWFLLDEPKLSSVAKQHIENGDHLIYVSPASYWELAIKISLDKYQLPESLESFMQAQLHMNDFRVLPITIQHADRVSNLPFHHRDPFDRMLIAQALTENIALISVDLAMDAYGVHRIW